MRVFITGSSDGLGKLAALDLLKQGHQVVLHARNSKRAEKLHREIPNAEKVLIGDLSDMDETTKLATDVNAIGEFDAVIHNAGIYRDSREEILMVNCIAPYILTCLIRKPKRLIYLSSGLHAGGRMNLEKLTQGISYPDSKLYIILLANLVALKWPDVYSNSVNPGWVPTKMGGSGAPDDLNKGFETQVWLATSNCKEAMVSGKYFFHRQQVAYNMNADDRLIQEEFLEQCYKHTGVAFPDLDG